MKQSTPVGAIDLIIARIDLNRNLIVVTDDKDFELIRRVAPELRIRQIET